MKPKTKFVPKEMERFFPFLWDKLIFSFNDKKGKAINRSLTFEVPSKFAHAFIKSGQYEAKQSMIQDIIKNILVNKMH
jgi:hypothetical protein